MEFNTKEAQGLVVKLPQKEVIKDIGDPYAGNMFYYSGMGNGLDNTMVKSFTVPADGCILTAKVNYQIELDWDYAYVIVFEDGKPFSLETNLSTNNNPNGQNLGNGITGESAGWVDLTADLSAYAGKTVTIGFQYWTDDASAENGLMIDNISFGGPDVDGAEDTSGGWIFDGFRRTTGTEQALYEHYYIAEYRTYEGYDSTLEVGPYFFGYLNRRKLVNYVDRFAYQDGLLISYWDTSQTDNDTALHPGKGLLLPIDAHYQTLYRVDKAPWRNRIQTYDSTFSLEAPDGIENIHVKGKLSPVEGQGKVSEFDSRISYYDPTNPCGSVMNPNIGVKISILKEYKSQFPYMVIKVSPSK
jgi:immune inhibitor A